MRLWLLTISFASSTTKIMYNVKRGKNMLVYMYVYVYISQLESVHDKPLI